MLGIPLISDRQLQSAIVKACGQRAGIVPTLREIAKNYSNPLAVPIEFLQNASDAKAKEFAIMLDETSYAIDGSLFGPEMKHHQGPALLLWNNKKFKKEDLESVLNIFASEKRDKADKLGMHGQGLNSAYNLADILLFVTGKVAMCFDPHTTYLPQSAALQPGIQLKLEDSTVFEDQFKPLCHNQFGFTLSTTKYASSFILTMLSFALSIY